LDPSAVHVVAVLQTIISQVVLDNGNASIDNLFAGKKAVGSVLCVAFCPTVAAHPVTGTPTVMPLKVATLVNMVEGKEPSLPLLQEIERMNHEMQTVLGQELALRVSVDRPLKGDSGPLSARAVGPRRSQLADASAYQGSIGLKEVARRIWTTA
jgi:hypothetical protein